MHSIPLPCIFMITRLLECVDFTYQLLFSNIFLIIAGVAVDASGHDIQLYAVSRAYCWLCNWWLFIFNLRRGRKDAIHWLPLALSSIYFNTKTIIFFPKRFCINLINNNKPIIDKFLIFSFLDELQWFSSICFSSVIL